MRIFITGATGFIGQALTQDLIAKGHRVIGLARTSRSASQLRALGAEPHPGSLRDLASLRAGAALADGVAHLAFTFSPGDLPLRRIMPAVLGGAPSGLTRRMMAAIAATNRAAVDALGASLQRSDRPFVTAFATMGVAGAPGERALRPATEADPPNPRSPGFARASAEDAVQRWATDGVRASVVRLAPSVHGDGDKGLIPQLIAQARKSGDVLYVGEGDNRWAGVSRADAVTLFRLALEHGVAGGVYHGAAESGVPFRQVAEVIGRRLNLPTRPATLADAATTHGWLAPFIAVDNPVSSDLTQAQLGWRPAGPRMIEDIDRAAYISD